MSANQPNLQSVTGRRAGAAHTSMFLRMLWRAAVLRRGRAASALLAMVVAAAVATAMMNLYVDVQAKLRKEFRNYGANVVVVGKDGAFLSLDALTKTDLVLSGRGMAVPFAYLVARTTGGQSVVVAGTDLDRVRRLDTWWKITPVICACLMDPSQPEPTGALLGTRTTSMLTPKLEPFDLSFQNRRIHLRPSATIQTGAAEDSRVYLSMTEFVAWSGVQPSTIEVAANGSQEEVNAIIGQLTAALPTADVRPLRQIMEGEARVLGKTRATLYAAAVLIILTAALCVLATLTGWVFDRRRDFAIMKALGASERLVSGFFAAEAVALGAVGAVLGFVIGIGIAAWIGRVNFNAPVVPRLSVLPFVMAGSMALALLSAMVPMSLLRRIQPAVILKGE
jgi:putative ABC transport system permease protein